MVRQMDNGLINVFDTIIIILFFYVYKQNFLQPQKTKTYIFITLNENHFQKKAFNDMEL